MKILKHVRNTQKRVCGGKAVREFDRQMAELDDPVMEEIIGNLTETYWSGGHIGQPSIGMMSYQSTANKRHDDSD